MDHLSGCEDDGDGKERKDRLVNIKMVLVVVVVVMFVSRIIALCMYDT